MQIEASPTKDGREVEFPVEEPLLSGDVAYDTEPRMGRLDISDRLGACVYSFQFLFLA